MSRGPWRYHPEIIREYASRYPDYRILIETGTGEVAETCLQMVHVFDLVFTIDIDPENTVYAIKNAPKTNNLVAISADSELFLPHFVPLLGQPCFFFLDAHWDHDIPRRRGLRDTPLEAELQLILGERDDHLILIDDARFITDGPERDPLYPSYDWILDIATKTHDVNVSDDVIRIVPKGI